MEILIERQMKRTLFTHTLLMTSKDERYPSFLPVHAIVCLVMIGVELMRKR